MHRGRCVPTPRHARYATSVASPAGETGRYGFNTPLAQRELRARGRNWFEGRIAECPRLQQNGSSDDLPFCLIIVALGSPPRPSPEGALPNTHGDGGTLGVGACAMIPVRVALSLATRDWEDGCPLLGGESYPDCPGTVFVALRAACISTKRRATALGVNTRRR
jgi:hypothetical protein